MTVKDLMTSNVRSCNADTDLATAATIMWNDDCGIVPVVKNDNGEVVGVITDRDICIAAATRHMPPQNIRVADVITGQLYACSPQDDVLRAVRTMSDRRVRRIPVIDRERHLIGILSMNDVVGAAACRKGAEVPGEDVLEALQSICAHSRVPATA
jgi:CBS domain-containing protein